MVSTELRATMLYAGVAVARRISSSAAQPEDAIRYLKQGDAFLGSLDYESASRVALTGGWDIFGTQAEDSAAFRSTIENLIVRLKPDWADRLLLGRLRCMEFMTDDAQYCFQVSGLLDPTDEAIEWWDRTAGYIRHSLDQRLLLAGRRGERKTLEREKRLLRGTGQEPRWVAIEDNTAGYDVSSWRRGGITSSGAGIWRPHYIEVKASARGEVVYLTRREWEIADERSTNWELQVWIGDGNSPVVLTKNDIHSHIPSDGVAGKWQTATLDVVRMIEE